MAKRPGQVDIDHHKVPAAMHYRQHEAIHERRKKATQGDVGGCWQLGHGMDRKISQFINCWQAT